MMPPDTTATAKPPPKDATPPSATTRKVAAPPPPSSANKPPSEQSLKCPRCDSSNTKFCYYNNYSLTQPRHFCKTCRRYWTKGGALRNVPIGGGCRKNKKLKSSSSSSSTTNPPHHHHLSIDPKGDCASPSDYGGLKFFSGQTPAVDFHLPGWLPAFPGVHSSSSSGFPYGQFPPFSDVPAPPPSSSLPTAPPPQPRFPLDSSSGSLLGFNYPLPSFVNHGPTIHQADQIETNLSINSSLASSIESLSSINQDLHWKLQQQRLSMLFGNNNGENTQKEVSTAVPPVTCIENAAQDHHHQVVKPQHATFLVQNQDSSSNILKPVADVPGHPRKDGDAATEWFFGNSYAPTDSDGNGDGGNGSAWNSGIPTWGGRRRNLNQFNALP